MKNRIKTGAIASLLLCSALGYSQNQQSDSLGLPGDNLDLNAVLSIFKESSSVEDFEKKLNSADPKINNLDLNNDQKVDYLRVVDYGKDDFHSLVIQDPVSKSESQDIAVVEVQKNGANSAHIQIVGDEAMYGKNYIIEPTDGQPQQQATSSNSSGTNYNYADDVYDNGNIDNSNNSAAQTANSQIMVNAWGWPGVNYLYAPGYSYWVSPWYYGYYPGWYSPWTPYYGFYAYHRGFYGMNYGFYGYRTGIYAFPRAHHYYYGHRMTSGYVQKTAAYGRRDGGNRVYNNGANRGGQRVSNGGGSRFGGNRANNGGGGRNNNFGGNSGGGRVQNSQPRQSVQSGGNISRGQTSSSPHFGGNSGGARPSGGGGGRVMGGGGGGGGRGGGFGGGGFGGGHGGGGGGGFGGGHGGGGRR